MVVINYKYIAYIICLLAIVIALVLVGAGERQVHGQVTVGQITGEVYQVKQGDTLESISYKFMNKSAVKRNINEFREGIIENNQEVFADRCEEEVVVGDKLIINYVK